MDQSYEDVIEIKNMIGVWMGHCENESLILWYIEWKVLFYFMFVCRWKWACSAGKEGDLCEVLECMKCWNGSAYKYEYSGLCKVNNDAESWRVNVKKNETVWVHQSQGKFLSSTQWIKKQSTRNELWI